MSLLIRSDLNTLCARIVACTEPQAHGDPRFSAKHSEWSSGRLERNGHLSVKFHCPLRADRPFQGDALKYLLRIDPGAVIQSTTCEQS